MSQLNNPIEILKLLNKSNCKECNELVSFKSVYLGIFCDFFIAQIQLLLMSTGEQKSFLCENGPPRSSSEHRGLLCGKSATYSFLMAVFS